MTPEEALKFCANYITYLFGNISGAARPIFNSIMFQAIINQDQLTINFLLSKGLTTYARVSDIQRLVGDLRDQGYAIEDVPRDNNCLFWAVAMQLNAIGWQTDHHELRLPAVSYMEAHPRDFWNSIESTPATINLTPLELLERYTVQMARLGEQADQPIIIALAQALEINIEVHNIDGAITPILFAQAGQATPTIHVAYTGSHYFVITHHHQGALELAGELRGDDGLLYQGSNL